MFSPDKQNGFDVQSEADAMIERQQRDILPGKSKPTCVFSQSSTIMWTSEHCKFWLYFEIHTMEEKLMKAKAMYHSWAPLARTQTELSYASPA